ncbi:MAG: motility associated factor glycosyltransferase family protein [Clostridia bacterium]
MGVYEKNIEKLELKDPQLAEKLLGIDDSDVEVLYSKTAFPIVRYNNMYISSAYDPEREAVTRVNGIDNLNASTMVVSFGFGMGYELRELCNRVYSNPATLIIAIVCNLKIFKKAMACNDLTDLIMLERLLIMDGTREDFNSYFFTHYSNAVIYTEKVTYFLHPIISNLEQETVKRCAQNLRSSLFNSMVTFGNAVFDTLDGIKQILDNTAAIINSPDLTGLKGCFKGIPAICVATGPSLDKNIGDLKAAVGKAVIFAGESNIAKLRNEGVKFDAACIIERVDEVYEISLGRKPIEGDVVFFGDAVVKSIVFEQHKGKNIVVFRSTTEAESIFSRYLDNLNDIPIGLSVAHMNLAIANYLGFSPIILVGQDLAYSEEGKHHASKTLYDNAGSSFYDYENFLTTEIYVKGINGDMVRSNNNWKSFLDIFAAMIAENNMDCIDATEGGAYIPGTKVMTLKEAMNEYCSKELEIDFRNSFREPDNKEKEKREVSIRRLAEDQICSVENSIRIVEDTIGLIESFNSKIKYIDKYKDYMAKKLDEINFNYKELMSDKLFAFVMQPVAINYARESSSLRLLNGQKECEEFCNMQMKYYEQFRDILKIELEIFKKWSDSTCQ